MNVRNMLVALALSCAACGGLAIAAEEGAPKPAAKAEAKPKAKAKKLPKVAEGSTRATLKVEMCCAEGCPVHIRETLAEIEGVTYYDTDFDSQTVTVDYVAKDVKLQAIKDAILELGYPVDGVQPKVAHGEGEEG
jgi:copper chaperone CopZ